MSDPQLFSSRVQISFHVCKDNGDHYLVVNIQWPPKCVKLNTHVPAWKCQWRWNRSKLKTNLGFIAFSQRQLCSGNPVESLLGKKETQWDNRQSHKTCEILKYMFNSHVTVKSVWNTGDLYFKRKCMLPMLEVDWYLNILLIRA